MTRIFKVAAAFFLWCGPAYAIEGTAIVIDGDTITVKGQRIRLHGIDAPESAQVCLADGRPWYCGKDASAKLREKIDGRLVQCDEKGTDRYGRTIATCSVADQDLEAWMVEQGWAVAYRKYSLDYMAQEEQAKVARRGIWASDFEMPWDWRRRNR